MPSAKAAVDSIVAGAHIPRHVARKEGKRAMFGYPSAFLNGNMLACVFQDRIMVRLAERDRADALAAGAKPFEPSPGRAMTQYVDLPPAVTADPPAMRQWIERGHAYGQSLPKKAKKKSK